MISLTPRQVELYDYIKEFMQAHRYAPSYREIAAHFGYHSVGAVHKQIQALKNKGFVDSQKGEVRSLSIAEKPSSEQEGILLLSLIGYLDADLPMQIFAEPKIISVPKDLVSHPDKTYAIVIHGDGFHEELLADGDLLIIEGRQVAEEGDVVIALIDAHYVVIKKYFISDDFIHLKGCYAHHQTIVVRPEDIFVQGVLLGVMRNFMKA